MAARRRCCTRQNTIGDMIRAPAALATGLQKRKHLIIDGRDLLSSVLAARLPVPGRGSRKQIKKADKISV
jgi:hypothetical protein